MILKLAKALTLKGHICDIVLYNGKERDWEQEYKFVHNGETFCFKIYWLHGYNILKNGFMPSVKKVILQYDVIQVHEYEQMMSWQFYTKQIRPTVIYHGPYYDKFAKGYNLKCKLFDMFFLPRRQHDDVVVLSKSTMATDFMHSKGFRDVTTVGVGIDLDNFGEKAYKILNRSDRQIKKNILYVGKLEERRNMYFLAEVFRKIHKKDNELKLIIIGSGEREYKEKFLNSIKAEIEAGDIVYIEKATQIELLDYYNEAAFFLLASNYDIFGMVLLEAMYFGAPVISSMNGGACTLIKNEYNGFIMERFDSDSWAECILNAIQNRTMLEKMKVNARRTIEEGFIWETLVDTFIHAYERAIVKFEEKEDV